MIIDNHSDLMRFLNEYGNDNITFFFDIVSRNFSISTKAKKFFGKEKLTMETLSEILGHKSPTITLNRYAHSLIEHKKAMMNKIGKLL